MQHLLQSCCIQAKTAPLQVLCAAQAGAEAISGAAGRAGSAAISVPVFGTDPCKLFQGELTLRLLSQCKEHFRDSVHSSQLVKPLQYTAFRQANVWYRRQRALRCWSMLCSVVLVCKLCLICLRFHATLAVLSHPCDLGYCSKQTRLKPCSFMLTDAVVA